MILDYCLEKRQNAQGKPVFFLKIGESLDLHPIRHRSILLQRGMTDLPLVLPPALPGRFLPELGRSFWSGLFFCAPVAGAVPSGTIRRRGGGLESAPLGRV